MKQTTRLQILDHIRKHQGVSAAELSRFLSLTGADIRHHLAILEANDLIEVVGQLRKTRGRPANLYGLSRRMLGDGMQELASGLLDSWLAGRSESARQQGLRSVARSLAGEIGGKEERSVPRRLSRAVSRLNDLHYQAHWEAGAGGPRLILGHCPYSAILTKHPELCKLDAYLLENLLSIPVFQTDKLQPGLKGLPFCAFQA